MLGALLVSTFEAGAQAPTAGVERGRHLVESILGCGNCHTPKSPTGEPIASRNLSGGGLSFSPPPFVGVATNITPDRETGIGSWSDDEIKRAIVEGKRPNHGRLPNTELAVVMATSFFKALTRSDLDAVVAYLRSVPAVRNEVATPLYRLPQKQTMRLWRLHAPPGFIYAVKASRYHTHMRKLKDPADPLALLFDRARDLCPHLGPVLYQLPPRWKPDLVRLQEFLQAIPRDVQQTIEFRDAAWYTDHTFELLADYGVALCLHDMTGSASPRTARSAGSP
jgi:mono/diheme cytochrome c family protein